MSVIKLLHDITQLNYQVYFDDDFEGMLTVTFYEKYVKESGKPAYVRHEHLGYPGNKPENFAKLEKEVIRCLENFLDEIVENRVEKDGLA